MYSAELTSVIANTNNPELIRATFHNATTEFAPNHTKKIALRNLIVPLDSSYNISLFTSLDNTVATITDLRLTRPQKMNEAP